MQLAIKTLFVATVMSIWASEAHADTSVRGEFGTVQTRYNSVQIPNSGGTRIGLPTNGTQMAGRVYVHQDLSDRWDLRFLYAPLTLRYSFTPKEDVKFNGTTFDSGQATVLTYKFDSFRFGARYMWLNETWVEGRIGALAKWRSAFNRVQQGGTNNQFPGDGFVPLLHASFEFFFWDGVYFLMDLDGLAAPQGRALDGLLELGWKPVENFKAGIGFRSLEGGADNDVLRTFAMFNFWLVSATVSL